MTWLPEAMRILRQELPNIEVTVSSDYSPDLAEAVARGRVDIAFMRQEPNFNLDYQIVAEEALIVLMPSDHRLTAHSAIRPEELVGEPFIAMGNKATVLRAVIDRYLTASNVTIEATQTVDNPAMVMSLVASTRGLALIPSYVENLMPWSVVSRPLAGDGPTSAPTIALALGYSKTNTSPILRLFLSRIEELIARVGHTGPHHD
jgi:LysR family hca operon transcriptional activator